MVSGSTELDALGDEMMFDEDSSYLDDASTAPSIPEGLPGDKSTSRVRSHWSCTVSLDTGSFRAIDFFFTIRAPVLHFHL